MPETPDFNDLCVTCIYGPTCTRRIYARAPIWYCNEFDDHDLPTEGRRVDDHDLPTEGRSVDDHDLPTEGRGIDNNVTPAKSKAPGTTVRGPAAIKAPPAGSTKGLCANCENSDTCLLPRPEGGVWHCEEYL